MISIQCFEGDDGQRVRIPGKSFFFQTCYMVDRQWLVVWVVSYAEITAYIEIYSIVCIKPGKGISQNFVWFLEYQVISKFCKRIMKFPPNFLERKSLYNFTVHFLTRNSHEIYSFSSNNI